MELSTIRVEADSEWNSCKNYQLANLFPARAVALGCLYAVLEDRGLKIRGNLVDWVDHTTSGRVDMEDFEEVIQELREV